MGPRSGVSRRGQRRHVAWPPRRVSPAEGPARQAAFATASRYRGQRRARPTPPDQAGGWRASAPVPTPSEQVRGQAAEGSRLRKYTENSIDRYIQKKV